MSLSFAERLAADGQSLRRDGLHTLQVNLGKVCNQTCRHCHVDASPFRTESMDDATVQAVMALARRASVSCLDLTGGAPELHPRFRDLVRFGRAQGLTVIDRCNLTILSEPGQEDLADFLADQGVEVVASLPCHSEANVDAQRGDGVFTRSIAGLRRLNALGYGQPDSPLRLNLVYNPGGPFLPPPQEDLARDYHARLEADFGVRFHGLYTITNMPIARFAGDLRRQGRLEAYWRTLAAAHNPAAVDGVMCRTQLSVGYDGTVYDCDFHQMVDLPLHGPDGPLTVHALDPAAVVGRPIRLADHCYGCTAGAGSSCGGALT